MVLLGAVMVPQKTKCFLGYHKSCICYKIDLFSLSLFGPRKLYLLQKEWVKEGLFGQESILGIWFKKAYLKLLLVK